MKSIYKIVFILLGTCLLMQCRPGPEVGPTKKELLVRNWKVSRVYINEVEDLSTDYSSYIYAFSGSGSYTFVTALTSSSGEWEFNSTETMIVLDKGTAKEITFQILRLDDNQLEVEFTLPATWKEPARRMRLLLTE